MNIIFVPLTVLTARLYLVTMCIVVSSCACFIHACILQRESEDENKYRSVEEGSKPEVTTADQTDSSSHRGVKLAWCVVGLQVSYLMWGVLQERIMTQKYDGDSFSNSQFLVFVNRILAFVIAGKNCNHTFDIIISKARVNSR